MGETLHSLVVCLQLVPKKTLYRNGYLVERSAINSTRKTKNPTRPPKTLHFGGFLPFFGLVTWACIGHFGVFRVVNGSPVVQSLYKLAAKNPLKPGLIFVLAQFVFKGKPGGTFRLNQFSKGGDLVFQFRQPGNTGR